MPRIANFGAKICTSARRPIQSGEENFLRRDVISRLKRSRARQRVGEWILLEIAVMMRVVSDLVAEQLSCAATYQSNKDVECLMRVILY